MTDFLLNFSMSPIWLKIIKLFVTRYSQSTWYLQCYWSFLWWVTQLTNVHIWDVTSSKTFNCICSYSFVQFSEDVLSWLLVRHWHVISHKDSLQCHNSRTSVLSSHHPRMKKLKWPCVTGDYYQLLSICRSVLMILMKYDMILIVHKAHRESSLL